MSYLLQDLKGWLIYMGPAFTLVAVLWALVLWALVLLFVRAHLETVELAVLRLLYVFGELSTRQLEHNLVVMRWAPLGVYLRRLERQGWCTHRAQVVARWAGRTRSIQVYKLTAAGLELMRADSVANAPALPGEGA